jgi:hypothetical protein
MRRVLFIAFLILASAPSCISPGVRFPDWDRPTAIGGVGVIRGARRPVPPPQPVPCREITRVPCDLVHCGGSGFDYVTYRCLGNASPGGRCVSNGGCLARTPLR